MKNKADSALLFLGLNFLWSWSFWGVAILLGEPIDQSITMILMALGGLGPLISTLFLLFAVNSSSYRREYVSRLFDPRRIPLKWGVIILLFTPALTLIAFLLSAGLLGTPLILNTSSEFLGRSLGGFIWLLVFTFFFGPFPEEAGWRGYALDRLQKDHSALTASLLLGAVWALWHLPLVFIQGTYQSSLGIGSPIFWRYMLSIVAEAVFITWVYNHTQRSALAAVLFHFVTNLNPIEGILANRKVGAAYLASEETLWLLFGIRVLAAVVIVWIWGARTLAKERKLSSESS